MDTSVVVVGMGVVVEIISNVIVNVGVDVPSWAGVGVQPSFSHTEDVNCANCVALFVGFRVWVATGSWERGKGVGDGISVGAVVDEGRIATTGDSIIIIAEAGTDVRVSVNSFTMLCDVATLSLFSLSPPFALLLNAPTAKAILPHATKSTTTTDANIHNGTGQRPCCKPYTAADAMSEFSLRWVWCIKLRIAALGGFFGTARRIS